MAFSMRVIDGATVRSMTPYSALVPLMIETMITVSRGEMDYPPRTAHALRNSRRKLGVMLGSLSQSDLAGVKLLGLGGRDNTPALSSHLGLVVLYSLQDLIPLAALCAATITARRTAAASAAATDALARKDARCLTILGTGEQAEAHLEALAEVRKFEEVRLWGRSRGRAEVLGAKTGHHFKCPIRIMNSVSDAVAESDVVTATTASPVPILAGIEISPGCHVNLVGSSIPTEWEADTNLVSKARYFVDYRPAALLQAGELLDAIAKKVVTADHIVAEIGQVYEGSIQGRRSAEDITLYKSLGNIAQDIATAKLVYTAAERQNIGTVVTV